MTSAYTDLTDIEIGTRQASALTGLHRSTAIRRRAAVERCSDRPSRLSE
ncbi:hypothetical protein [Rhodococcus sp. H29-C3]|nr:hypothetical protein [Rhodococcus sp. H29-C3]MDJ0361884.1 hypothetical protein [Rhodococcus sp. H29-C3]